MSSVIIIILAWLVSPAFKWYLLGFCAVILLLCLRWVARRRRAVRAAAAYQQAQRQASQAASVAPAPAPAAPAPAAADPDAPKPAIEAYTTEFVPPSTSWGYVLAYSYPDVGFYAPDDCRDRAAMVPPREALDLCPEPSNPYDSETIAIYHDSRKIGYMYHGKLRDMVRDYLERPDDRRILAVSAVWSDDPIFGLYFYRSAESAIESMRNRPNVREFKLSMNRDADTQASIALCSVGDDVTIEYDEDEDQYTATVYDSSIGVFPASAAAYLNEFRAFDSRISQIDTDDSDKYVVHVILDPN